MLKFLKIKKNYRSIATTDSFFKKVYKYSDTDLKMKFLVFFSKPALEL